jgi:hypothetical protein
MLPHGFGLAFPVTRLPAKKNLTSSRVRPAAPTTKREMKSRALFNIQAASIAPGEGITQTRKGGVISEGDAQRRQDSGVGKRVEGCGGGVKRGECKLGPKMKQANYCDGPMVGHLRGRGELPYVGTWVL